MILLSLVSATFMVAVAPQQAELSPQRSRYNPDRVVCRSIVRTGTRHAIRTCLTVREWEIIDEHAMELIREVQRKPIIGR